MKELPIVTAPMLAVPANQHFTPLCSAWVGRPSWLACILDKGHTMLRYPLALLIFLTQLLPAQAQECGALCDLQFWRTASSADVEVQIEALISTGAGIDQAGVPLQMATSWSSPESIRALILAGADVNIASGSGGLPPLSRVISSENAALASLFLEAGADVNAKNVRGNTALQAAAAALNQPQTVALLIAAGAETNAQNSAGDTALHVFAFIAGYSAETYLIAANIAILKNAVADFNIQNNEGQTALHIAASGRNPTLVSQLLAAGADGSLLDAKGRTAFVIAAELMYFAEFPQALAALEAAQ